MTTATTVPLSRPTTKVVAVGAIGVAAALALVLILTMALGSDGPPAVTDRPVPAVEVPLGSPDALERRSLATQADADRGDPNRFGSPDAAERWAR